MVLNFYSFRILSPIKKGLPIRTTYVKYLLFIKLIILDAYSNIIWNLTKELVQYSIRLFFIERRAFFD